MDNDYKQWQGNKADSNLTINLGQMEPKRGAADETILGANQIIITNRETFGMVSCDREESADQNSFY